MRVNFKAKHGTPLVDAGYMLVPIAAGKKFPTTKGWPKLRATVEDVKKWARTRYYGGLGVLGEFNPGIDIDVQHEETAELLVRWCMKNIGTAPVRIGNWPRVLIPCSAPEGGIGPDNSNKYEDDLECTHQVEIKATGQQWVAYGTHPGTGKAYTWKGGELHENMADLLPTLTGEKITALFKYFEQIRPQEWTVKQLGRERRNEGGVDKTGELSGNQAFENYTPPLNITTDKLRSMLDLINPDEGHEVWLRTGMALYHQYKGSDEGLDLFSEWSEKSSEYDLEEIKTRWPTWEAKTYSRAPVTAATIVKTYNDRAKKSVDPTRRPKSNYLSYWERRYGLIELTDGSEVHDMGVPLYKSARRTMKAFAEHNAAYTHKTVAPDGEVKIEPMTLAWKSSKNTRHFAGYTYQPGKSRYTARENCYNDDSQYVNTFYFPPHNPEAHIDRDILAPFSDFLKHLFPEEVERKWFIEWLARLIQNPGIRSFVTPISVTAVTGTGRGILFEILRVLIGGHNCHDVSRDDMEGRFNGFLDKCIIAVVQEIKAATGDHKYQMWERMKSLLADTTANIQAKGQDSYTATVYANFLMFSNNIDALPIEDLTERRIYAMKGADRPISTDEIDRIITWKDDKDNMASLFRYLRGYPVDESNFKRAPVSETKKQMVAASIGSSGSDLAAWLKEEAPLVFDYDFAAGELDNFSDDMATTGISRKHFSRSLSDRGYHSKQIRGEHGRRVYVFYHPSKVGTASAENLRLLHNKPRNFKS